MYVMARRVRTPVYFTADQRRALDEVAERAVRTIAEVIREATAAYLSGEGRMIRLPVELVSAALAEDPPRPTLPLTPDGWGDGDDAERVGELLERGFGETA